MRGRAARGCPASPTVRVVNRAPLAAAAPLAALALLVPVAPAAGAPRGGAYAGRLADGQPIALTVRSGRISGYRLAVRRYDCELFGDIGPLRVRSDDVGAAIGSRGGFGFTRGPRSERVRLDGRFGRHGIVRGRVRITGTIATGDRCASRKVRFSARRAGS